MASGKKAINVDKSGVDVKKEDQDKINRFANYVAKRSDLRDDIESKQKWLQSLGDIELELMELEDDDLVPYQIGEVFFQVSSSKAQEYVEEDKKSTEEEMVNLRKDVDQVAEAMKDLKAKLYAKFGDNINLEDETS
jgi:prefoldin subunit 4